MKHLCKQAKGRSSLFICVGNDADVREVVAGENGLLQSMPEKAIIVDHTTTSNDLAIELADLCQQNNCLFLDAPVSGGEIGAKNGTLIAMVGGNHEAYLKCEPYFRAYTKYHEWFGKPGSGQLCKMVNQTLITGIIQGLAEGVKLALESGLDIKKVVELLQHGAAQSWQLENRALSMSEHRFNFGFAIEHMNEEPRPKGRGIYPPRFNFASNIGALVAFLIAGKVVYEIAIPLVISNIIGNHVGSSFALKRGAETVRKVLVFSMLVLFMSVLVKYMF